MRRTIALGLLAVAFAAPGFAAEMKGTRLGGDYLKIPFASRSNGKTFNHMDVDTGTVEFWVKPDLWYDRQRRGLFYCGRRSNGNCLSITKRTGLTFFLGATNNKALISTIGTFGMKRASWRHIAYCWDVRGGKAEWAVFIDGKRAKARRTMGQKSRKFAGLSKRQSHIYLGTYKSNTAPKKPKFCDVGPKMTVAQFRISDVVRYGKDFVPPTSHTIDAHTRLYFPFKDGEKGTYYRGGKVEPGTVEAERVLSVRGERRAAVKRAKQIPAFPGAQGFGSTTPGGRGGRVIEVTNLNVDGPGSLQAACSAKGPRIVVFRVSGLIPSRVTFREPFVTIAGQTAPGDGICIRGSLGVNADHAIVRYVRLRPGDHPLGTNPEQRDCFSVRGKNVVIDHCSASWGIDENTSVYGPWDMVTVQWCITSEALYDSIHPKGPHGKGMILGCASMARVSVHHCLFAHNSDRNPLITATHEPAPLYDIRNNVCYARFPACVQIKGHPRVNLVGHTIRRGVPGPHRKWQRWFGVAVSSPVLGRYGPALLYVADNRWPADPKGKGDPWAIVSRPDRPNKFAQRVGKPLPAWPVATQPAAEAYEDVLRYAGATRPVRDVVDDRIVAEVRAGLGGIIDSQEEVGGWPNYASAAPPPDADHDGMPDAWEKRHGLNPSDPADGPKDRDGDGYTNVEEYLNRTDPAKPDTGAPIAQGPVKVQAGNDRLRREAARKAGEERLARLMKPNATDGSAGALLERTRASGKDVAEVLGVKLVRIEPGAFEMPNPKQPRTKIKVRITKPYEIGATEVTQGQWEAVMGTRPWQGRPAVKEGPDCPATYVSYIDAQEFLRRLNACGGPKWRLPTQAEWRLAARGGTSFAYGFKDDVERVPEYAHCCSRVWKGKRMVSKRFPTTPIEAGRLKPNPFGLHDMAGNVREWVSDYASMHYFTKLKTYGVDRTDPTGPKTGTQRTVCGGHFRYMSRQVLDCLRRPYSGHKPYYRGFGVGFRVARDVR